MPININTTDIVVRGRFQKKFLFLAGAEFLMLENDGVERCTNLVSRQIVSVDVWDRFATKPGVVNEVEYDHDLGWVPQASSEAHKRLLQEVERCRANEVQAKLAFDAAEKLRKAEWDSEAVEREKARALSLKFRAEKQAKEDAYRAEEAANRAREKEIHGDRLGSAMYRGGSPW